MKKVKLKNKPIGPPRPKEPGRNITKFLWKPLVINEEERWLETVTYREIWESFAHISWYKKICWIGTACKRCGNDDTIQYRTKTWYGLPFGTKYLKCRNCTVKYAIPENRTDKVIYEFDINKINPALPKGKYVIPDYGTIIFYTKFSIVVVLLALLADFIFKRSIML